MQYNSKCYIFILSFKFQNKHTLCAAWQMQKKTTNETQICGVLSLLLFIIKIMTNEIMQALTKVVSDHL
jgi:hypothetical protein